jgi:hypothetical protein
LTAANSPESCDLFQEPEEIVLRKQVNIINLDGLSKELTFSAAKLKLIRFNPVSSFDITSE